MSNVEEEVALWSDRMDSILADPDSSLQGEDYLNPTRLLKRTAEAFELRRPRRDSDIGKQVIDIARALTESTTTQSRRIR